MREHIFETNLFENVENLRLVLGTWRADQFGNLLGFFFLIYKGRLSRHFLRWKSFQIWVFHPDLWGSPCKGKDLLLLLLHAFFILKRLILRNRTVFIGLIITVLRLFLIGFSNLNLSFFLKRQNILFHSFMRLIGVFFDTLIKLQLANSFVGVVFGGSRGDVISFEHPAWRLNNGI